METVQLTLLVELLTCQSRVLPNTSSHPDPNLRAHPDRGVKEVHARLVAEIHIMRVGLALLQSRKTHGTSLQTLDDLPL